MPRNTHCSQGRCFHKVKIALVTFTGKQQQQQYEEQVRIRSATLTLALLVTSYLCCNLWALFIRVLEVYDAWSSHELTDGAVEHENSWLYQVRLKGMKR